jgi:hypothetical protein
VPFGEAPALFAGEDEDQCYVARQPETPAEVDAMVRVLECADLNCIRYAGNDRTLLRRLRDRGLTHLCDDVLAVLLSWVPARRQGR